MVQVNQNKYGLCIRHARLGLIVALSTFQLHTVTPNSSESRSLISLTIQYVVCDWLQVTANKVTHYRHAWRIVPVRLCSYKTMSSVNPQAKLAVNLFFHTKYFFYFNKKLICEQKVCCALEEYVGLQQKVDNNTELWTEPWQNRHTIWEKFDVDSSFSVHRALMYNLTNKVG